MSGGKRGIIDEEITKASVYFRPGQFIYIGKGVDTVVHDHHAIQIAIGLEGLIEIRTSDATNNFKAAIIDSDQPHECRTFGGLFILINIAPESNIGIALKYKYIRETGLTALPAEETCALTQKIKLGLKVADPEQIFASAEMLLRRICDLETTGHLDERVERVLQRLNHASDLNARIKELAAEVSISPGRLIHLFTEQVGIPIRKYILWRKLLTALQALNASKDITTAALDGGFSDAPHFNRTFRRMFGLNPSILIKNSQIVQAYIR